jgi:hypothetical protein
VAALSRAGAREAYLLERGAADATIVARDALSAILDAWRVVASDELATAFGLDDAVPPTRAAEGVARRAAERAVSESTDDLRTLEPLYLRAPRGLADTQPVTVGWR